MYCVYLINGELRMAWKVFRTLEQAENEQKKLAKFYRRSLIECIVEKA